MEFNMSVRERKAFADKFRTVGESANALADNLLSEDDSAASINYMILALSGPAVTRDFHSIVDEAVKAAELARGLDEDWDTEE